ncbi:MAG TPA: hypothetical protein VIT65_23180 [Microlunatus sp.]
MTVTKKEGGDARPLLEFDYPWIRAWGAYIDATRPMIEAMLERARRDDAPETAFWWEPDREIDDNHWDDEVERWVPTSIVPAHWDELLSLMHGSTRQSHITDARIFLWDWGMSREIYIPRDILRAWLGETILDSPPDRW